MLILSLSTVVLHDSLLFKTISFVSIKLGITKYFLFLKLFNFLKEVIAPFDTPTKISKYLYFSLKK